MGEELAASEAYPGLVDNLIVAFYAYVTAGPPWLTATLPNVDSRTYLDMQFHTLATDPGFQNVRGLMTYRSNYADEETVRWAARLFRHYGIEGHIEMLSKGPYLLTHLQNPEFEQQGVGWNLEPAETGTISFDVVPRFGGMQGRYPRVSHGDTVIVTTRSDQGPNVFSQEIKDLAALCPAARAPPTAQGRHHPSLAACSGLHWGDRHEEPSAGKPPLDFARGGELVEPHAWTCESENPMVELLDRIPRCAHLLFSQPLAKLTQRTVREGMGRWRSEYSLQR